MINIFLSYYRLCLCVRVGGGWLCYTLARFPSMFKKQGRWPVHCQEKAWKGNCLVHANTVWDKEALLQCRILIFINVGQSTSLRGSNLIHFIFRQKKGQYSNWEFEVGLIVSFHQKISQTHLSNKATYCLIPVKSLYLVNKMSVSVIQALSELWMQTRICACRGR